MAQIIWTNRALKDLEEIGEYISRDSFRYAKLTLQSLINTARIIENNLLIGRIVPELKGKNIREIISGNYRIIYQVKGKETAFILIIHHSSRLVANNPGLSKK